ncbi:MAG: hypothetical protein GKR89_01690 [Candidatus Latescibacteria bacterium]|nr:hypothetical protein [Candidatus Latescibacterota bacterium]
MRRLCWNRYLLITALGGFLLASGPARAAINPDEFRRGSPECLTIEVVATQVEATSQRSEIYLAARVVAVTRSATELEAGSLILIAYRQDHEALKKERAAMEKKHQKGWAGPQLLYPPAALTSGDTRQAHLALSQNEDTTGKVYTPGAHQYSFEPESTQHQCAPLD